MPLPGPTHIPPIGEQTDPDNVRVAAVVGGQLASAPARGFGLTTAELTAVQAAAAGSYQPAGTYVTPTAEARNRIVNGAMQVSQENGNTSVAFNSNYGADQWMGSNSTATIASTSQRVQVVTSNGSINRIRSVITTGGAGGSGNCYWRQVVEGIRMADFRWGSASAKQIVLRFGWKSPAGTYSVSIRNSAVNRSYLANFTITAGQANTDTEQTIIIPGDVTGTWLTDTGIGAYVGFTMTTNSLGVTGWQSGNFVGTLNNTIATSAVFELFDVGLYMDPLNTGVAPRWTMPDEAQELAACQRYYNVCFCWNSNAAVNISGTLGSTFGFPVQMRTTPAQTFSGTTLSNCASLASFAPTVNAGSISAVASAAGQAAFQTTRTANARM